MHRRLDPAQRRPPLEPFSSTSPVRKHACYERSKHENRRELLGGTVGTFVLLSPSLAYLCCAFLGPLLQVLSPRPLRHFVQAFTDEGHGFLWPLGHHDFDSETLLQVIPLYSSTVLPQGTTYRQCFRHERLRLR